MKNLQIALLSLLISNISFAKPGFYNPQDPKIPQGLKAAANSVFEVRTAYFEDYENATDLDIVDVTGTKTQEAFKSIDSLNVDKKDKQILKAFVAKCKTPEEKESCPIPKKLNSGSGFITGQGATLWTNAHVMEHVLKMKAANNDKSLEQILSERNNMPIFVFDKNGNMIFNGLESPISFKVKPKKTQQAINQNSFYGVDSDYIAVNLPRSLGIPLKVAKTITNKNIAVIGYPACTNCTAPEGMEDIEFADRYPYPNAEDCIEKATTGEILDPNVWAGIARVGQYMMQTLDTSVFMGHTADSQHGMSGGPILNANGEVVGIHAGGKSINTQNGIQRVSRGVRPGELLQEP